MWASLSVMAVCLHVPNALAVVRASVEVLSMVFCNCVCVFNSVSFLLLLSSLMAGTLTFCIPVPCTKQDLLQNHGVNA